MHAAFEAHYGSVLAYAAYRTSSSQDAEEIASTTFLTAWRRVLAMPEEPATLPWLYAVAKNTLANQRRSISRRGALTDKLARQPDLSRTLQVTDGRLEAVISHLTPGQQTLIRLSAWDEVSYVEGAAILKCSANAYAIRLHRARDAVKVALAAEAIRSGPAKRPGR